MFPSISRNATRRSLFPLALATAALVLGLQTLSARELDSFTIRMDNDFPAGTDEHYTAGTEFDFAYRPWYDEDEKAVYHQTLALGQWIFTPENVDAIEVIENDRPFAGWTYLRYGQHRTDQRSVKSWQLTLGLVGPSSFAEDIMRSIHKLTDNRMPLGWRNQLSDELGVALERSEIRRLHVWNFADERGLELASFNRFALGNVDTSLTQGFQLRYGRNLNSLPSVNRIGSPAGYIPSKSDYARYPKELRPRRLHWIAGARSTYVARNLFLDGNSNGRSHSVDREPFVHEGELGFAYSQPGFKASVSMVYRTKEFELQEGGQTFASFAVTIKR
ncbi:lipid A deacylase LpxR family protein [Pelagicoccus albus]|uniref:Lipid A deacylase LpxR family protein n=1 Tax=Pelagicoccus albus TaxID=415222 RepID=A0A7X1B6V4_9BACT|nr:lipid A deacylase LpxR family protein [Pelagicoccus albus]MBC2606617.1 lipid A deacylase LpxR family protein [Pelagicoccus albus]